MKLEFQVKLDLLEKMVQMERKEALVHLVLLGHLDSQDPEDNLV